MNPDLDFMLSSVYDGVELHPEHLADLRRSGLTDETIARQKIRSVPRFIIPALLGFDPRSLVSGYLVPFPSPHGSWLDHVRLKLFPTLTTERGTVKYLQPRRSGARLFFPLATLHAALKAAAPLWAVEGEKKALAVAQLGLPTIGFCGIEGWHAAGSCDLLEDFDVVPTQGRLVEVVPDGDWRSNPNVRRGAERFAQALKARGATPRLVVLPEKLGS